MNVSCVSKQPTEYGVVRRVFLFGQTKLSRILMALAIFIMLAALATVVHSKQYPNRAVRLVVGYPPGGSNDLVARIIGANLSESLKQNFVIDNRTGAGGQIANTIVAGAAPDGHTILLVPASFSYETMLYAKLPYDPKKHFTPVSLVATAPFILLATNPLPVSTVGDLVALAKAKPGQINFAHAGVGNFTHLTVELLKLATGIDLNPVSYKGSGPGLVALISGEVQVTSTALLAAHALVKSGKIRALAVTASKRSPLLPEVPTVAESGVHGFEAVGWWGLLLPSGSPVPIRVRLNSEIARSTNSPQVRERLAMLGADAVGGSSDAFAEFIQAESRKWGQVITKLGINVR